jgi:hypothetical protein
MGRSPQAGMIDTQFRHMREANAMHSCAILPRCLVGLRPRQRILADARLSRTGRAGPGRAGDMVGNRRVLVVLRSCSLRLETLVRGISRAAKCTRPRVTWTRLLSFHVGAARRSAWVMPIGRGSTQAARLRTRVRAYDPVHARPIRCVSRRLQRGTTARVPAGPNLAREGARCETIKELARSREGRPGPE